MLDALQVIAQEDDRQEQDDAQHDILWIRAGHGGNHGGGDGQKDGQHLADAVNHRGVADEEVLLDLGLLGGRESAEIGIAEAAFDCYRLDGLSAHRAGLGICFHACSSSAKAYTVQHQI